MKKVALLLALVLAGCATPTPQVHVEANAPVFHPPLPSKRLMRDVEWHVITDATNTWFALDANNYRNLADNISDISGYIQELRVVVSLYQDNINTNNIANDHNSNSSNREFFSRLFHRKPVPQEKPSPVR